MASSEERMGKAILRWQPAKDGGFVGTVILDGKRITPIQDDVEERLIARLRNEAGKLHPDYVGFDGAKERFLYFFPEGFSSRSSVDEERTYKETAATRLRSALSVEQAAHASDADGARVASSSIQTNMLSLFEAARLNDTLKGKTGGQFLRGAAKFLQGDYQAGIDSMSAAVHPHGRVSWPIITYLPFLWDYDRHMFLKPTVTIDFSERVGHNFQHHYEPEPNPKTYLSLLDLVLTTRSAIETLAPHDNIDIQSFIWVVGEYRETDKSA
jgi:hypothetical protein